MPVWWDIIIIWKVGHKETLPIFKTLMAVPNQLKWNVRYNCLNVSLRDRGE